MRGGLTAKARRALGQARRAGEIGGTLPAVLNAANEIAVDAFLSEKIRFTDIPAVIEQTLERVVFVAPDSVAVVEAADAEARACAAGVLANLQ